MHCVGELRGPAVGLRRSLWWGLHAGRGPLAGAGVGRLMSRILDRIKNREPGMIPVWIVFEIIFGLAIAAPFIQSLL